MKKWLLGSLLGLSLVFVAGCGTNNDTPESQESTQSSEAMESKTVFTGTLTENLEESALDAKNVLLFLENVEAIEDPENIVPTFTEMGVGINVDTEDISYWRAWRKGSKVEVTLKGLPATTASIPPQVAGNALENITLLP
ncbi:hypothetical protein [Enterococcus saccharolyticus]|uniref:Lipoprotein n=1 Tax=Enterococcus saccharolyticus subsp. saccharolyticus ATCC 43076 TaxID=1139996 RepID=S0NWR5_9ENTE|nr:hypothetical protein [Enterococcus saccharolyticus]EOT29124.1 hypothetical protein OMQ_01076 [Enterococcus saccharolyticus subsp. saccharolyticus ATCC 43076]EOT80923.1 hypothetical protein I572_01455 [Enterococcus saccharolyticus subsp. saccharolyticus ATCC 43076]OJG89618.1 hypothetical protein RV16_GL002160 [Enterococcus saccharolyticus]